MEIAIVTMENRPEIEREITSAHDRRHFRLLLPIHADAKDRLGEIDAHS
jgi:hypothetical protein